MATQVIIRHKNSWPTDVRGIRLRSLESSQSNVSPVELLGNEAQSNLRSEEQNSRPSDIC